ncbi:MAG: cell division protein ZapE [Micrococcus sp.]|nr:cell division protein ZapE [Micrococcus sp.]
MRVRRRSPWPRVRADQLTATLEAGGKRLDAGQHETVRLLTARQARGVYLHGGVGRGKTWICGRFFDAAEVPKVRMHMHALLGQVNQLVAGAPAGRPVSFDDAVRRLLGDARLVYIDEFHVHDVGDAHLLRRVLPAVLRLEAGVLLTSNYPPGELLPNPLFHHHVEPVIALVQEHLTVHRIPDGLDYRPLTRGADRGFAAGTWTVAEAVAAAAGPDGAGRGGARRDGAGRDRAGRDGAGDGTGPAAGVSVPVGASGTRRLRVSGADPAAGTLTATFAQLCGQPVSVQDYLGLAQAYERWWLLGVPAPQDIDEQAFQRFAYLVDVLVDADLRLDVTAALSLDDWTRHGRFPRDADRFLSRLSLLRD